MTNKLIFVVDDDLILRNAIGRFLSSRGFEVKTMTDGFDVLLLCEYLQPDLIISDIRMPKLDGITLLQGLRNNKKTRGIPVIFMSAFNHEEIMEKAKELGAEFFLFKPFPLSYLEEVIENALVEEYTINSDDQGD
jgi:CheY-like chemotaxis protein